MAEPLRGELWLVDLGEPLGHEQGWTRPALVVSHDRAARAGVVVVCPVTRTRRPLPSRVEVEPGTSGLDETSYVQVDHVRSISPARLVHRLGRADPVALEAVQRALRFLLL